LVSFRNRSINIDWSSNLPIIIIADVFSVDPNTLNPVNVIIQDANNVSTIQTVVNSTYTVVTITYNPKSGEYPTFQ
jgi:hypothetical protein